MTEQIRTKRTRRPLRTALIAAAAVTMMVVGVSAANPEGFQAFVYEIMSAVQVDDYRMDLTTTGGEQVTVFSIPQAEVRQQDGQSFLVLNGETVAEITDALEKTGAFTYESSSGDSYFTAAVKGTVEDWTIELRVCTPGQDALDYTFTMDGDGNVVAAAKLPADGGGDGTWTSVSALDGESLSLEDLK